MKPETVSAACRNVCLAIYILGIMAGVHYGAHRDTAGGLVAFLLAHFGLIGSAYLGPAINRLRESKNNDREWAEQFRWRH
jgi:hypothetical protein